MPNVLMNFNDPPGLSERQQLAWSWQETKKHSRTLCRTILNFDWLGEVEKPAFGVKFTTGQERKFEKWCALRIPRKLMAWNSLEVISFLNPIVRWLNFLLQCLTGGSVSTVLLAEFILNCSSKSCWKLVHDLAINVSHCVHDGSCRSQLRSICYKSSHNFCRFSTSQFPVRTFMLIHQAFVNDSSHSSTAETPHVVKSHFSRKNCHPYSLDDDSNRVEVLS